MPTDLLSGLSERRIASQALHERVRAFASDTALWDAALFNALAWDIALYQRRYIPGLAALWGQAPFADASRDHWATLPAVPVEALRFRDVFAFAPSEAAQCFRTSGTTSTETGRHWLLSTETYRQIVLLAGKPALLPHADRAVVLALLPFNGPETSSSLEFMAQRFMEAWDGRALSVARSTAGFQLTEPGRWLLSATGIDVEALRRGVALAQQVGEPVLLLTTSFALLGLLDQLAGEALPLPPGSVVMPTGGFKGRTREVDPAELRAQTQALLRPHAIVHEYGMTELASQLYERPSVATGDAGDAAEPGLYFESRTVRVVALDPVSLLPVPDGEVGIASFIDLGNVDSAVRILTQDRVVRTGEGIRLLGRSPRAPARGCSLLAEVLSSAAVSPEATAVTLPQLNESTAAPDVGAALTRVNQLLTAARVLQSASSAPGRELRLALQHQGLLSAQGVELALQQCLETTASSAEVNALLASVVPAPRVWVLLSANVFVGAHRAIALGLAASADVRVRPSRRDPHLARALSQLAPGLFQIVAEIEPTAGDHVYAYGSDETLSAVRKTLPNGVFFHAHGTGIGVAWASEAADIAPLARALAQDMALFDQRGCLSPRLLALTAATEVNPWLRELGASLAQLATEVPLGTLNADELAAVTRFRTTAALAADELLSFAGSWIAVQHEPERILLPPSGRHLVVVTGPEALQRIAQAETLVTCVGVTGHGSAVAMARQRFPLARVVPIGSMQRPRFDGPVDRRQARQGVKIGD